MFRGTHHRHLHIGRNAYRNHAASDFRAQTYARIKSLRNNIDKPAFADQFQSDIGIALFKYCQLRQQDFINGMLAGIDAYRTGGRLTIVGQRGESHI